MLLECAGMLLECCSCCWKAARVCRNAAELLLEWAGMLLECCSSVPECCRHFLESCWNTRSLFAKRPLNRARVSKHALGCNSSLKFKSAVRSGEQGRQAREATSEHASSPELAHSRLLHPFLDHLLRVRSQAGACPMRAEPRDANPWGFWIIGTDASQHLVALYAVRSVHAL